LAHTEELLREGREAYLQQFYRNLDDPSLRETLEEEQQAHDFRELMSEQSHIAYNLGQRPQPTWLPEYWEFHPYDPETDQNIPVPSPPYIRDRNAPFASNQQLMDRWHHFRRSMAHEMSGGPQLTDDTVYEYWLAHPINVQVDDQATIDTYDRYN
jgi:hypothetical protein